MYHFLPDHSENCTSSPELVGASSAVSFSDMPASVLSRLNLTAEMFYSKDSATEFCPSSQSGTMLERLKEHPGADSLTLCAGASRVKTSVVLEKEKESKGSEADCGKNLPEWFAKLDPLTSSWKTRQCSLFADLEQSLETWPRWGMMRNGECFPHPMLEHLTSEKESGYWPTPCLPGNGGSNGKKKLKEMFPTPRASTGKHGIAWCRAHSGAHRSQLEDLLGMQHLKAGNPQVSGLNVNPDWQDWLMGWPIGQSDLRPLEMAKYQAWLRSHGESYQIKPK